MRTYKQHKKQRSTRKEKEGGGGGVNAEDKEPVTKPDSPPETVSVTAKPGTSPLSQIMAHPVSLIFHISPRLYLQ